MINENDDEHLLNKGYLVNITTVLQLNLYEFICDKINEQYFSLKRAENITVFILYNIHTAVFLYLFKINSENIR